MTQDLLRSVYEWNNEFDPYEIEMQVAGCPQEVIEDCRMVHLDFRMYEWREERLAEIIKQRRHDMRYRLRL